MSTRALRVGRLAVGVLYIAAGAFVNALFLATGDDYAEFARGAYLSFVWDTWQSLVVPNHEVFSSLLIVFELTVGVLVLSGERRAEYGLAAAIGFHVALLSLLWAIPMLVALVRLLRAQQRFRGDYGREEGSGEDAVPRRPSAPVRASTCTGSRWARALTSYVSAAGSTKPCWPWSSDALGSASTTPLVAVTPEGRYVIEMTPVVDDHGAERGVVAEGAVGTAQAGRFRVFRYEVRRWLGGVIPDVSCAVGSPVRISDDPRRRPAGPRPGAARADSGLGPRRTEDRRDVELKLGHRLAAGVRRQGHRGWQAPWDGRAPGWSAGRVAARRLPATAHRIAA